MFAISFTTRCIVCRAAFVAFCLAPTCGVLVWAGWLQLPPHRQSCRSAIEQHLQVSARLDGVEHPRLGVTILTGLELDDPVTGQPLLRCARLEAGRNGSAI